MYTHGIVGNKRHVNECLCFFDTILGKKKTEAFFSNTNPR